MRYVGTGTDPRGRYAKGLVVDAPEEDDIRGPLENGYVEPLAEDPVARSEWSLADAAIRGDLASLPNDVDDFAAALASGLVDEHGRATPRARAVAEERELLPGEAGDEAAEPAPSRRGKTSQ